MRQIKLVNLIRIELENMSQIGDGELNWIGNAESN